MTARLGIEGAVPLADKLKFLVLTKAERRKAHAFLGRDLQRALQKEVKALVLASPLELFEGSESIRAEKAKLFVRTVGMKATEDQATLYDKDVGFKGLRRRAPGDRATREQAARLIVLGYLHGKKQRLKLSERQLMRTLSRKQAGVAIQALQAKEPVEQRNARRALTRKKQRGGSLILMVWRLRGQEIVKQVDPLKALQRFLKAKRHGKA